VIVQRRLQPGGNSSIVADKTVVGWVAEWLKAPVLKSGNNCPPSTVWTSPIIVFPWFSGLQQGAEQKALTISGGNLGGNQCDV
jgi:hypothetical protein